MLTISIGYSFILMLIVTHCLKNNSRKKWVNPGTPKKQLNFFSDPNVSTGCQHAKGKPVIYLPYSVYTLQ